MLLDFNPAGDLGSTLRKILESSSSPSIQLRHESIGVCEPALCDRDLSAIILRFGPDVIFLVWSSNLLNRASVLFQFIRRERLALPVLVVIEVGEPEEIFELLKLGVADFITPPLKAMDILPRMWRFLERTPYPETLGQTLKERLGLKHIVGESPLFLSQIKKIPLVARCDIGVLISGETGTGKELFARAIHYLSPRAGKPFITVNCGAIPTELMESELFGHKRGAYTGAFTSHMGLIHEADGGTLFLDEVDCIPLLAQVKFLRFLQEKEFRSLGSTKMQRADVRVIAATNIDLEVEVREKRFRQDLYYRLNIIPIILPPLRERPDDIQLLAHHFLSKYSNQFNKQVLNFSPDALQKLQLYNWPGNVRELEHMIEQAIVLSEQAIIQSADFALPSLEVTASQESFKKAKERMITQFERAYIQGLLLKYEGNVTKAAHAAQKNQRTFWKLIRKYRINLLEFRSSNL